MKIKLVIEVVGINNEEINDQVYANVVKSFPNKFSVINIVDQKTVIIGTIEHGEVSLSNTIVYLGPTTEKPVNSPPSIQIGFASGSFDPDGHRWGAAENTHNAVRFGINLINTSNDVLSYYQIATHEFAMGTHLFIYDWAYEAITTQATEEQLGVAVISPYSAGPCNGLYIIMEDLGYNKLEIAGIASATNMTSEEDRPRFIRVNTDTKMYAFTTVTMMRNYKWNKIAVVY
jgi:hypothetical protein